MAKLKDITVKYHDKVFMQDFCADFGEGLCAVFGESGSGKTVISHIIAGLTVIEKGEVFVGGKEIGALPPKKRSVSLISKETLLKFKTVKENLFFPLKLRKQNDKGLNENEIECIDKKICELTEEEKAEVYFARALIKNPDLILVDEPAQILRERGVVRLIELCKKCNKNVIWLTSDIEEVRIIDSHTKIIRKGKILFEGNINELTENPPDSYTAVLMGYNIIDGRAVLPTAFFRGSKKIEVEVKYLEKLDDGFYLHCSYKDLPVIIYSDKEMSGCIEINYDEEKAVLL